ncbi:MAG: Hsp20/alpha crystallin family protein [Bdellovibrionales bacterium]|nr:Hsp20/alpha crystallin family protein [Bdellovibrionales bacterium]
MKKILFLISFLFIFLNSNLFAQSSRDAQMQKQVEEIMKARREMLDALMNDSGDLEKRMLEMMKKFSDSSAMGGMGFGQEGFEGLSIGEYDWIETDSHKILKIKIKQVKDHPLDIKIENGNVKIKGDVETTLEDGQSKKDIRKVSFERSFSIPQDVDQKNPEFENIEKDSELLIKFKRLSKLHEKAPLKAKEIPKKAPDRTPIAPSEEDLSI